MHYNLEVIMPPVNNVEQAIADILEPFNENNEENKYSFWDFYSIGGRYSGSKAEFLLGEDRIKEFMKHLQDIGITVSSIQFGKQELSPASQIPLVDKLWNEWFPDSKIKTCPLFSHSNDRYNKTIEGCLYGDILTLGETPLHYKPTHVIIAAPDYGDPLKMRAEFMITDSIYNGVCFLEVKWKGTLKHAIEIHKKRIKNYTPEARKKYTPKKDWLVVTIDCHS